MLSDEEKEAIDLLKNIDKQKCMMLECPVVKNNIERQLKIIELNRTIRKQSKEIEKLKVINQMQKYRIEVIDERELISKDKIKAKIEELEKEIITGAKKTDIIRRAIVYELQSLLEKE